VFIVVGVYFVIDSVRKLLNTPPISKYTHISVDRNKLICKTIF